MRVPLQALGFVVAAALLACAGFAEPVSLRGSREFARNQ